MKNKGRKSRNPARVGKNYFVTKSGSTIKLHRSLTDRLKAHKEGKSKRKAAYLSGLPKGRVKRFFARFEPKRMYHYWFSRDGAIMALKIAGIGMVAGFLILVGLFAYFRKDLPNLKDLSGNNLGGSIRYYDRTGETLLWEDYAAVKRTPVKEDQISTYMKEATIAVEDKDFFKHGGFDVRGIARAGINDVVGGGGTQGGSTITQQVVKLNQNWTNDRSLTRKVKELILAVELEREYSKNEILTGYLNIAPYGGVEYGVESASRDYFGVSAKDLTLAQAAMLASIPKAPTAYSPYSDPRFNPGATANFFDQEAMVGRAHYILDQMVSQGRITKEQAEEAKKVDVVAQVKPLQPLYNGIKSPYFVLAAKQELNQKYGEATTKRGGWKVTTTLDMKLQAKAEEVVAKNAPNAKRLTGGVADTAALVAEDVETGQIVSLVGGTDFNNPEYGKINYAASALIPPGSSFKPYDYAVFIDNNTNVGAGSVLYDSQGPLPGYPCTVKTLGINKNGNCLQDYDFKYPGPVTLRYALGGSRNVPAVKAMLSAVPNDTSDGKVDSINKVITTASNMMANPYNSKPYQCYQNGVDINIATSADVTQCYGASAIGDGAFLHLDDHVNGLATMARLGNAIPRTYILKITDSASKTVNEWTQPKGKQVIKPDSAYIVNDMASDPNASYLPASYKFQNQKNGWKFAVKTGTTNNGYDGLMTSWSSKYAVVTWVGNHTRNKELKTAMEYLTQPLARGWMEAAHADLPAKNWAAPAGIKTAPAFVVRTHIGIGSVEPSKATDLFPSWYQGKAAASSNQTIDKVSNKTATSCTPEAARDNQSNANANSFSVDIFVTGANRGTTGAAQAGDDDVHKCTDVKPSITVTAAGCDVVATVSQGTHALSSDRFPGTVTFIVNGQNVSSANVSASPSSVSYTAPTGTTSVTAKVSDSVLYEASATTNVSCAGQAAFSGLQHTGGGTYTWAGGTGNVTIYRQNNNAVLCGPVAASSGSCAGSPPPGSGYYAKDGSGAQINGS